MSLRTQCCTNTMAVCVVYKCKIKTKQKISVQISNKCKQKKKKQTNIKDDCIENMKVKPKKN